MAKILIVRFSSIGDMVLTTPVVRCVKEQLGAELHYLTKRRFRAIVDSNPYIDKVYAIEKRVEEVLPALCGEQYDFIIDLHRNLRSRRLRLGLAGVPARAFDKLNWEKWLLVNLKINRLPPVHIVDRYLAVAAPLGVRNDGRGLDYFIPPAEEVDPSAFLAETEPAPAGGREGNPVSYTAFAIGAAHATKRLPADRIAEICRRLTGPVILLGGPEDASTGEAVTRAAGPLVINACGRTSLHQSASLVRQAAVVITHDTGLMHIAAAFGRPIVSIWGNTVPAFGMTPYYPSGTDRNQTIEVLALPCRPCSKIGYARCPRGHFRCMRDINPETVARAAGEGWGYEGHEGQV